MKSKRLIVFFVLFAFLGRVQVKSDEGIWLPFMIDDALFTEMQQLGLNLTKEQIFSFTESSIKDAIVHFGGGCTAEIISDQGLVLTNHHCGYRRIQALSTVENDILKNGFWADELVDELPNPGLFVRFLISVEDVTEQVLADVLPEVDTEERNMSIRSKISAIISAATTGNHYSANVRPMFAGNEYFLFVYETYNDVRLVGTPPESVGAYGGDTDNWMWPRHTGDFSLFRVYSAHDGSPAEYSPDNIPLKPRHYLPISIKGVAENDFAMILGYPGNTNRYMTSYGIEFNLEYMFPVRIDIRRKKLDIIEEAMASSDELRIKYSSKQAGIANYWKNFIGMSRSLKQLKVADTKRELESEFEEWLGQDIVRTAEYGHIMESYDDIYVDYKDLNSHNFVFAEAMASGPDLLRIANLFERLHRMLKSNAPQSEIARETEGLRALVDGSFRDIDPQADQQLWAAMFEAYAAYIPAADRADIFQLIAKKYRGDFKYYAADVYKRSIFSNPESIIEFLNNPSLRKLEKDPGFMAARSVFSRNAVIMAEMEKITTRLNETERLFLKGLREMKPDVTFYPDANSTMRFTFGTVKGYHPADAVYYDYQTTLDGMMQKEDPNHHEFVVPDKLKELYQEKDYGRYGTNGGMIVNFIANLDITGGNSGSPVINGDGHLIGLAFDGNWEAMSGDILFEHQTQRCINVDARYILFLIDQFAGAKRIIEEMTIID